MTDLTVIYESGVLKPIAPLNLDEGQKLQIRIIEPELAQAALVQALQPLVDNGAITLPTGITDSPFPETPLTPYPDSQFETYSPKSPSQNLLSESIIEDRGPL